MTLLFICNEEGVDDLVEDIEGIILCCRFELRGKRKQCGEATGILEIVHGLGTRAQRVPSNRLESTCRDRRERQVMHSKLPHIVQSVERGEEPSGIGGGRGLPHAVERTLPTTSGNDQQGFKLLLLRWWDNGSYDVPQAQGGPLLNRPDQPLESGLPRQQDFVLYQPGDRVLKQDDRPLVAQPGTTVEPTDETKMPWLVRKISVAVELADRPCMLPFCIVAVEIVWEVARILNGKLAGQELYDDRGNSEWVG